MKRVVKFHFCFMSSKYKLWSLLQTIYFVCCPGPLIAVDTMDYHKKCLSALNLPVSQPQTLGGDIPGNCVDDSDSQPSRAGGKDRDFQADPVIMAFSKRI